MLTVRSKSVVVRPLTAPQIGEVLDSVRELGKCSPTIRVLEPGMRPHLLRVIAVSIRHEFPGATVDELAVELAEAVPCELEILMPILQALSATKDPSAGHVVVNGDRHEC